MVQLSEYGIKFNRDIALAEKSKNAYPFFLAGDPVIAPLFKSPTAKRAEVREFTEMPIEIYKKIFADDPRMLGFKDEYSLKGTEEFKECVDDLGRVYGNGVRSNFLAIRHVNGLPMLPATFPLADNTKKRTDSGLASGITKKWHENMFRSMTRLMFGNIEAVPLKWRRGSSTAMSEFTTSDIRKYSLATDALANAARAGDLMLKGRFEDAFNTYNIGGGYYVVYRAQSTDKITHENGVFKAKDRLVSDVLYALTGGLEGDIFPASKSLEGLINRPGFYRERRRTAMAQSGSIGFALMPVAQSIRKKLYEKFPFSFHHTSRSQKQSKIRDWKFAITTDVSDHDINWPTWLYDIVADELLSMGYADWWVEIFRTSFKLPTYVSAPAPDAGMILIGDWRQPDLKMGLPSGNPFTDLMGTLLMSVVYAIMQIEHTTPWYETSLKHSTNSSMDIWLTSYLKGDLEIGCMSKSDDAIALWKEGKSFYKATDLMKKLQNDQQVSDYMKIGYEHGGAFLGDILLYDHTGDLSKAVFIGNILSFDRSSESPEYSVDSKKKDRSTAKRPYPGLAWGSVNDVYGSSPIFSEVLALKERIWHKHFGFSYRAMRNQLFEDDSAALAAHLRSGTLPGGLKTSQLTPIELDVLSNPDTIHFKYSVSDVRPEVLEVITTGLPLAEVEPYVKSVVNNNYA